MDGVICTAPVCTCRRANWSACSGTQRSRVRSALAPRAGGWGRSVLIDGPSSFLHSTHLSDRRFVSGRELPLLSSVHGVALPESSFALEEAALELRDRHLVLGDHVKQH